MSELYVRHHGIALMQFGLNYPFRCIYYHFTVIVLSIFVTFIINYINQLIQIINLIIMLSNIE